MALLLRKLCDATYAVKTAPGFGFLCVSSPRSCRESGWTSGTACSENVRMQGSRAIFCSSRVPSFIPGKFEGWAHSHTQPSDRALEKNALCAPEHLLSSVGVPDSTTFRCC
eukprot:scaffold159696_cov22-Tisochrysis_lutea.AAC.1